MLNKVLLFIKYNNGFTIILGICFLSFGVTFAANPTALESIYASEEMVTSIDNQLILQADLDNFNFNLKIDSITEDQKNYYINYSYKTITLLDAIWQEKDNEKILIVDRESLGENDLGLYVAKELADNINYELSYLRRVQVLEKGKGESKKVVTLEYSGLIGKLLDPKEKIIEGYDPVIPVPVESVAIEEEADLDRAAVIEALIRSKTESEPEEESIVEERASEISTTSESGESTVLLKDQSETSTSASSSSSVSTDTSTSTIETSDSPDPSGVVPETPTQTSTEDQVPSAESEVSSDSQVGDESQESEVSQESSNTEIVEPAPVEEQQQETVTDTVEQSESQAAATEPSP